MKNIKAKYLWLGVAGLFVIAVGLIVGCSYADKTLNKILIVFLAIDFIALTILIQMASFKSFRYKPKLAKLPNRSYSGDIKKENLKAKGFKERETEFGYSYLKIDGERAFKLNIVNNNEAYFNPQAMDSSKPNKALDKCNRLIGIELFLNPTDEVINKLPDFSMQGDRLYYTALIHKDNIYKCVNYLEPNERFSEDYAKLIELLGLEEVSELIENI